MSEEQYKARIEELESENKTLKEMLNRASAGNSSAYNSIRAMIVEKVNKEIDVSSIEGKIWQDSKKQKIERNIMSDLKWNLRVRRVNDFRTEHIEQAKEFLDNYVIDSEYRKSQIVK